MPELQQSCLCCSTISLLHFVFFLWSDNLIDVHTHRQTYVPMARQVNTCVCVCVAEVKLLNRPLKNDTSSMRVKGPKGSPESRSGMQPAVNTWIIGEGLHYPPAPAAFFRGHATPPHQLQIGCTEQCNQKRRFTLHRLLALTLILFDTTNKFTSP